MSGGLAGVARYAGGSLAQAIYTSVLTNTQSSRAAVTVPAAAIAAGLDPAAAAQLPAAFAVGATALAQIPGLTPKITAAAATAFQWSYAYGLKMVTLSSLAFAGVGLICCLLCENIDAKMNDTVEVFLEK